MFLVQTSLLYNQQFCTCSNFLDAKNAITPDIKKIVTI